MKAASTGSAPRSAISSSPSPMLTMVKSMSAESILGSGKTSPSSTLPSPLSVDDMDDIKMGKGAEDDPTPPMLSVGVPIVVVSAVLGLAPVKSHRCQAATVPVAWAEGKEAFDDHDYDHGHDDQVRGASAASEARGNKVRVLRRSVVLELYSLAVLAGVTFSSYTVLRATGEQTLRVSTLAGVLVYSSGLSTAVVVVAVQIATLWNTPMAITSLEGLLSCEEETRSMTPRRVRKARVWIFVQLLLWVLVSAIFATYHFVLEDPNSNAPLSFCYRAFAVSRPFMHMSCIQFGNLTHGLSLQLDSINERLLALLGPEAAGLTLEMMERWSRLGEAANPLRQPGMDVKVEAAHLETVRELRHLHHKIHVVSVSLQSAFGLQMLLVLLNTLIDTTTILYILLGHIDHDIVGLLTGSVHVVIMLLVLTAGNKVRQQAQRMGEILQRGMVHLRLGHKLVDELQAFSLQLVRLPTQLSACGLMSLDYSMIQGAVGTVTTYLVIMLQFPSSGGKQLVAARNVSSNVTHENGTAEGTAS